MPVAGRSIPDTTADSEAFHALLLLAERRTGRIPPDLLVRHVLSVTESAGWPVQRAALEAVLRRLSAAKQDGLVVASSPSSGLGRFTTRRKGSSVRPYEILLEQIEPLRASCDCRDFVRNSLGLCKHVLTVVADRPEAARKPGTGRTRSQSPRRPRLAWDPIRPLVGPGGWMERVRLVAPSDGAGAAAVGSVSREHFRREQDGTYVLKAPRVEDAACRLEIVEALLQAAARRELAVDPPLLALLRREEERLAPVVRGRPDRSDIARALRTLKRRLYPYQRDGVLRFLATGRLLLADDMGLGKTAQAIASAHVLSRTDRVRRGLLIVPASLKDQWLREWRLFTDVPLTVVDGSPAGRAAVYRSTQRGFLVTNYEQVLRDLDLIRRWGPDLVVLDEAQRIKNWATKTAAYVKTSLADGHRRPGGDQRRAGRGARRAGAADRPPGRPGATPTAQPRGVPEAHEPPRHPAHHRERNGPTPVRGNLAEPLRPRGRGRGGAPAGAGLRAAFFTGQETSRRRSQNLVEFHDDPATAVLFSTDAGGVGLNLQRAASCCINLDLPWNPAVLEQRIGRIYRPGQKHPIDVYNLVTESSIEARIAALVADKKAFFSGLFDGDTNEVRFERSSSFLSRLERIMEPSRAPEPVADETSPEEQASAEREADAVVAAADEGAGAAAANVGRAASPSPGAVDTAPPPGSERIRLPPAVELRGWLSQLRVERRADGGLAIEAPPEAADGLAALFEGMGRLLREAGRASE